MTGPTVEQLFADYQAKLRQFHQRHGAQQHNATVTTLRPALFTGTGGK